MEQDASAQKHALADALGQKPSTGSAVNVASPGANRDECSVDSEMDALAQKFGGEKFTIQSEEIAPKPASSSVPPWRRGGAHGMGASKRGFRKPDQAKPCYSMIDGMEWQLARFSKLLNSCFFQRIQRET